MDMRRMGGGRGYGNRGGWDGGGRDWGRGHMREGYGATPAVPNGAGQPATPAVPAQPQQSQQGGQFDPMAWRQGINDWLSQRPATGADAAAMQAWRQSMPQPFGALNAQQGPNVPVNATPPSGWGNNRVGMLYRAMPNAWMNRNPWNSGNS